MVAPITVWISCAIDPHSPHWVEQEMATGWQDYSWARKPSRGRSALPRHPAAPMDLRQTSSKASAWVGMEQVLLLVAAVVVLSASTAVST